MSDATSQEGTSTTASEGRMGAFDSVNLYTDGGSRGNPGNGAIAVVICSPKDEILHEYSETIGTCTNNQAEYTALLRGLRLCFEYTSNVVHCTSDSELLVRQMTGKYKVKNETLRVFFEEAKQITRRFRKVTFRHAPRTHRRIRRADQLANDAQDGNAVDNRIEETC